VDSNDNTGTIEEGKNNAADRDNGSSEGNNGTVGTSNNLTIPAAYTVRHNERNGQFYMQPYNHERAGFGDSILVPDPSAIPEDRLEVARQNPYRNTRKQSGDPGCGNAPIELCTKVLTIYQQHNQYYCITYSLASALFYCGFEEAAKVLAAQAPDLALGDYDTGLFKLKEFMLNLVPLIGRATIYQKKTKRSDKKRRIMTWDNLINEKTIYPTLVIVSSEERGSNHAFCVVDDLIFDSTTPRALKLKMESIRWIFNEVDIKIHEAMRFNQKCNAQGQRDRRMYTRDMKTNWK
jgi:hypothetical protein